MDRNNSGKVIKNEMSRMRAKKFIIINTSVHKKKKTGSKSERRKRIPSY